jgi:hypothetical protein
VADDLLLTHEVAERYGVTPKTVRRWCAKGYLPGARKLGTDRRAPWVVPPAALEGFVPPSAGRPQESDDD